MRTCVRAVRRPDAGFTLAELIVATTMISIVMAGVYTAMHTAVTAWRFGETNYDVYDDARYTLGLLSRELQAIPNGTEAFFIGEEDELEFFTLSPPMNVEDGTGPVALQVTYRLRTSAGSPGRRLVREERIVKGAVPAVADCDEARRTGRVSLDRAHDFELARNVAAFDIEYFWHPPFSIHRNDNRPPPWIDLIVEHENRKCWGLPVGIAIKLVIIDPEASSSARQKTFVDHVVFRGRTSGLPHDIRERWEGGHY